MKPTRAAGRAAVGIVAVLFLTAGCGWAEWPPPERQPRDVNRPPPPAATPLPVPGRAPVALAGGVVVGAGDTVYALSRRHGVFVRAIIDANRLRPPYHLRAGQRVVLPRGREHAVRGGETLYGISRLNGVGVYEMARAAPARARERRHGRQGDAPGCEGASRSAARGEEKTGRPGRNTVAAAEKTESPGRRAQAAAEERPGFPLAPQGQGAVHLRGQGQGPAQ
jgi:LysM repeat protein